VSVAVGGDDGVERVIFKLLFHQHEMVFAYRFGVDGDEGFAAAEGVAFGAVRGEDFGQKIAPYGGMLEEADAEPGKVETGLVPPRLLLVYGLRCARRCSEARLRGVILRCGGADGIFVAFAQLAIGPIEFKAVISGWNVASCDHDRGHVSPQGKM